MKLLLAAVLAAVMVAAALIPAVQAHLALNEVAGVSTTQKTHEIHPHARTIWYAYDNGTIWESQVDIYEASMATEVPVPEDDFVLFYYVREAAISCEAPEARADASLTHFTDNGAHNHHQYMIWDGDGIMGGEINADHRQSFTVLDIDMHYNATGHPTHFTGNGLVHENRPLCNDKALFEFDLVGQCDGSSFQMYADHPAGYNFTSTNGFSVLCLPG